MSRSITSLLIVGIALSTILLIACSDESTDTTPSTTSTSTDTSTPSTTSTSTDTPISSETPAARATPTTSAALGSASDSSYEAFCSELQAQGDFGQLFVDDDSVTNAQAAATFSEVIRTWEASNPPSEAAAWHNEMLTALQSLKAVFDAQPGDEPVDDEDEAFGLASIRWVVNVSQAEGLLPRDTRNAMVSEGCLGDAGMPDNHGDEQSSATTIALGDEIEGLLNYLGDTDYFVFAAEAGTSYQIDMWGDFGWAFFLAMLLASTEEDDSAIAESDLYKPSRIVLYNPSGTELQSADLTIDFVPGIITWDATVTGDYYISLGDWEIGEYTLSVVEAYDFRGPVGSSSIDPSAPDDHGNDINAATAVSIGTSLEAALNYEGDVDYFRFTARAGQLYQVDVALGTLHDSELSLLDSHDVVLASNDDYGETYASRIVWSAPASGDYFIEVSGWWGDGTYSLTVTEVP